MHHQRDKGDYYHHHRTKGINQEANIKAKLAQLHPAIYRAIEVKAVHYLHQHIARQNERNRHAQNSNGLAGAAT